MRFAITFAVLALGVIALLNIPFIEKTIVDPLTGVLVSVCGFLLNLVGASVAATSNVLSFKGAPGAVSVENGCNAVEVCVLLASAIIAWPATIRAKAIGVVACVLAVQAVNLARIISLLYLARYSPGLFEFFHLYVWEAMIMLEAVLIFFLWIRKQGGFSFSTPQPQ